MEIFALHLLSLFLQVKVTTSKLRTYYPAEAPAGSCILLISSFFFIQAHSHAPVFCFSMVLIQAHSHAPVFCFSMVLSFFLIQAHSHAPVFCFSMVLSFFLSSFFCQPYNLMYLRAALIDFNETWSQWLMTQPAYVIWPLTGSKVIQGHGGQKGHFHQKRIKSLGLCSVVL